LKLQVKHSLSLKLLRAVILSALAVGILLSCAQVILDVYSTRRAIDHDAQQILAMFREPSTQALYSLDQAMGMQVIEGLFRHASVQQASIGNPNEPMLAEKSRPPLKTSTRWLTDLVFGEKQRFSARLVSGEPYHEYYGDIAITLDTALHGEHFVTSSLVILVTGLLRALAMSLVLYLLYHWLLTKPLSKIIGHLDNVNPERPSAYKLPVLVGHEVDELGLWISTANQLLASIERSSQLRREAEDSLQRMSLYDLPTGLPNRQQLQKQLEQILQEADRLQYRTAVLCIGLDDFKDINEQYSYQTGDQLLLAFSERLRSHEGRLGALARLGGDQFTLVQSNIEQPYESAQLAQRILDDLVPPFIIEDQQIQLRATIGITLYPEDGSSPEKLLQKAEQTMTLAKVRSRNHYQFYVASVDQEIRHRRELEKDLREALLHNQLYLVYQPQINYSDQYVVGVEALLRWRHPQHGLIAPDLFIPLAEQNGTIIGIGEWVLDQACQQLQSWHRLGYSTLRMAVNLSTVQLHHAELPRVINNLLKNYQLPPGSLEIEVTETSLMEDIGTAAEHLLHLRRSGAFIAIDDFGTGYSSLSYLKSLPLDKIKIDKSFVQELLENEDDATIVRAIIQLGKSLGMQVIAEGVETAGQEAYVVAQGCHEGQGYFYSKPLPAQELTDYLRQAPRIAKDAPP
jgi:diguanylate cyclase (GGDEF)-like protein